MLSVNKQQGKTYLIIFLFSFAVCLFLPLTWGDDTIFQAKSEGIGLFEFINGSARPLTDSFTYIFSKYKFLWRIINPFVMVSLLAEVSYLLPAKLTEKQTVVLFACLMYPTMVIVDAGFIATTLNYLWAVTFGLLSLVPVKKHIVGNKVAPFEFLLTLPFLLYATNMQQMAVVLTVIFLGVKVYLFFSKRFNVFILIQFAVSLGGLAWSFCLNMFGDNNRMLRETGRYFPAFSELNLFEKLELGFSSTFFSLTMNPHFAMVGFVAFTVFISVMLFNKKRSPIICALSVVPPFFAVIMAVLKFIPESSVYAFITGGMRYYRMEKAVYSFEAIPDIVFLIIIAIVLFSLYHAFDNKKKFFCSFIVLCFGLGSRIMMGLSPTVWASGHRTFCIMFITFTVSAFLLLTENNRNTI